MLNIYKLIRLNRILKNHRLKFFLAWVAHTVGLRHLILRIDPVIACNLSCTMCHFSDENFRRENKGSFSEEELERIASMLFPKALQAVFGCGTEPTMYRNFPSLVLLAKKYRVPLVGLTSNGILLKKEHIQQLIENGLDELTLSVHGVRKETYEKFMVNSSYETFHQMLSTLEELKKKNSSSTPRLRLNYTVNSENLDELSDLFSVYGTYAVSTLQVRPVMDIGGKYRSLLGDEEVKRYNQIIAQLFSQCKERGITFLANIVDPTYQTDGYSSLIVHAVNRYISPQKVWREDFDWKKETYDQFCGRIGWGDHLIRYVFSSKRKILGKDLHRYAARYEVL